MKKKTCAKCQKYTFVEEHHILPQSTFGKNDETVFLCPNCHTEYHLHLGTENLKNPDMVFHFYTFYKWLSGLVIVIGLLLWWVLNLDN